MVSTHMDQHGLSLCEPSWSQHMWTIRVSTHVEHNCLNSFEPSGCQVVLTNYCSTQIDYHIFFWNQLSTTRFIFKLISHFGIRFNYSKSKEMLQIINMCLCSMYSLNMFTFHTGLDTDH